MDNNLGIMAAMTNRMNVCPIIVHSKNIMLADSGVLA